MLMIGMCFSAEDHKKKLMMLNQKLSEAREKLRCYEPQVENISSVQEADAYQEFLLSAMEQIRSQARLLGGKGYLQTNENVGVKWLRSTQRLPLLQEPVGHTSCEEIDWIATDRALASGVEQL
ncbi:hypothetical protein T459_19682 [Capsicum annuum]|uniref:Uncharacterized protein n=1 Tax=Capsicum annuum TaxID=4072 RepID=A0A2G2Z2B3_CAPAN|nr:hypothetical protein T459_19682 [Capsicum annuum]